MFTCAVCNSPESQVENVPANHIPAIVCIRCRDETFNRETSEKVHPLVHGQAKPTKSVVSDIFEFV